MNPFSFAGDDATIGTLKGAVMKIAIDYNYEIRFIPYRHQNRQSRPAAASTVVDIREFDSSQAPVVLRIGAAAVSREGKKFAYKEDGSPREIRAVDGQLYVENSSADLLQSAVEADINKSPLGGHSYNSIDQKKDQELWTKELIINAHKQPLRSIEDDGGEKIAELLQKRADKLIIVNGTVFKSCREPVLAINLERSDAKIMEAPGGLYEGSISVIDFIGYDLTTNLVEAGALLSEFHEPIEIKAQWDIFDPSVASFDGTSFDIGRKYSAIKNILGSDLGGLPRSALDLYYALRDVDEASLTRVTPQMLELTADAIALAIDDTERTSAVHARRLVMSDVHAMDCIGNLITKRANLDGDKLIERIRDVAETILGRWDMRPENWIEDKWDQSQDANSAISAVEVEPSLRKLP